MSELLTRPRGGVDDFMSPAEAQFAYEDNDRNVTRHRQTYDELVGRMEMPSVSPDIIDERPSSPFMPPMERKTPAQMYADHFEPKERSLQFTRERLHDKAPLIASLRTNVIIRDEYSLVTDLSYRLADRFSRDLSGIMINVDHSACQLMAGTFEPAYMLTIIALPSDLRPEMNRPSAAHIQAFMANALGVPPERGMVRFVEEVEDNLATNGTTVAGSIERAHSERLREKRHTVSNASGLSAEVSRMNTSNTSTRRSSIRGIEKISRPTGLNSVTIPERSASVQSGVSSLSGYDLQRPLPGYKPSLDGPVSRENSVRFSRQNSKLRSNSPSMATVLDWRPAAPSPSIGRGAYIEPEDVVAKRRREVVYTERQSMSALPTPPKMAPTRTSTQSKRKSLMSIFRR